ncbi:MAG: lytic transglycosylase domain-containing protein, partial [Saccharothrix sp.]|nr:lytic transglycosylase domain-containing protein [Saccharothrix sp.]
MTAYRTAADTLASTDPGCHVPWTLLAAIGRVESDHGRYGGSVLATDGVSRPEIIGVPLDGKGPVAAIHDTDGGRLDGDTTWDRAVGPMQFIPSTWAWAGRDGDGDGRQNPHDLDDAALAAGDYLCTGADLRDGDAMDAAILRYNPSDYYVALV